MDDLVQKSRWRCRSLLLPHVGHYVYSDHLSSTLIISWRSQGLFCYIMPLMPRTFSPILFIYMELYFLLKHCSSIRSFSSLISIEKKIMSLAWLLFMMCVYLSDTYTWWWLHQMELLISLASILFIFVCSAFSVVLGS